MKKLYLFLETISLYCIDVQAMGTATAKAPVPCDKNIKSEKEAGPNLFSVIQRVSCDLTQRKEIASSILEALPKITDEHLDAIGLQFDAENTKVSAWFDDHKQKLLAEVKKVAQDVKVEIMGSRRWNTSHVLSDIDAVIITDYPKPQELLDIMEKYYATCYPSFKSFKMQTLAGLCIFCLKEFSVPQIGSVKLEYTIQSNATNHHIVQEMKKRLESQFATKREKVRYSLAMMQAVAANDEPGQMKLKEWTRVLPHK